MDKDYDNLIKKAENYLEEKRYDDALNQVSKAIVLRPTDIQAWIVKRKIFQRKDENRFESNHIEKRIRDIFLLETSYKENDEKGLQIKQDLQKLMSDLDANGNYVDLNEAKRKSRDSKIAYARLGTLKKEIQPEGVIGSLIAAP